MASTTMQDLLNQAAEAGISSWTPTDGQTYDLEVVNGNGGKTKNGDPKFGVQLKVTSGPDAGKSFWTNYNLRAVKANGESNAAGLAYTFKDLAVLGAPAEVVSTWDVESPGISEQVKSALIGTRVTATASVSGDFVNLKSLKASASASGVSPAPPAAPAAAPGSEVPPPANRPF